MLFSQHTQACAGTAFFVIPRGNLLPVTSSFAIISMLFFLDLPLRKFEGQNNNESRLDLRPRLSRT